VNKTTKFNFTAAQIGSACDEVYKRNAHKYKVQGFREGQAPRKLVEQQYGTDVFFEPAMNALFNHEYRNFLQKNPTIKPCADPDLKVDQTQNGLEITVEIPIQDDFKLGKYRGLEIKSHKIPITDKQIDQFLERLQKDRARETDAPKDYKIQNGNIAVIDFVGSINGKEFQGGKGQNHDLEIGSHSFIEGFEEQLIGKRAGDVVDIRVTFPKDYHAKDLAGKPAVFKTTVKKVCILQLPKLDDAFAKESSEFDTMAKLRADIKKRLEQQAKMECDRIDEETLLRKICEGTDVKVNPKIIERQFENMMSNLEERLKQNGMNLETYAIYQGTTLDNFLETQHEYAALGAKTGIILDAIGTKEGIKDFDAIVKFLKENNKIC